MNIHNTDSAIQILGRFFLESVFPQKRSCAFCGRHWSGIRLSAGLCPMCVLEWRQVKARHRICPLCGSFDSGDPCRGPCSDIRDLSGIVAAAPYAGVYRQRVMTFKYNGEKDLAAPLAYMMARAWSERGVKFGATNATNATNAARPILVPVPMHIEKEKKRGYNQSRLLARAVSAETGFPVRELLCRSREGQVQAGLDKWRRQHALDQVFQWASPTDQPCGACVIIDDVVTTGATLESCGKILAERGCGPVWGLTFAGGIGIENRTRSWKNSE